MESIKWIFSGIGVLIITLIINKRNRDETISLEREKNDEKKVTIIDQLSNTAIVYDPILKVYERICRTLSAHEIAMEQFVEFIGSEYGFTYADVRTPDAFINKLSPQFIIGFCERFGIRKEWLEGEDNQIYSTLELYKMPLYFRDMLFDIAIQNDTIFDINHKLKVFALKPKCEFNADETEGYSNVSIIVREPLSKINNRQIYKYHVVKADLEWGYWKSRRDFKIVTAICKGVRIYMSAYVVSEDIIRELGYGRAFPGEQLNKKIEKLWYPEDYIEYRKLSELELNDYALVDVDLKSIEDETRKMLSDIIDNEFKVRLSKLENSN